jgi:hypothetical protein
MSRMFGGNAVGVGAITPISQDIIKAMTMTKQIIFSIKWFFMNESERRCYSLGVFGRLWSRKGRAINPYRIFK